MRKGLDTISVLCYYIYGELYRPSFILKGEAYYVRQKININDVLLDEYNSSKIYATGTVFKTIANREITIRGRVAGSKGLRFLVEFEDGFLTIAHMTNIKKGTVANPYTPTVYDVGCLGVGTAKTTEYIAGKKVATQEYSTWKGMVERCYATYQAKRYPTYKNVKVSERWLNFNYFCEDITTIKGYKEWKEHRGLYELDKDILASSENKIYSKDTCLFVRYDINRQESALRSNLTGDTYCFTRLQDRFSYITDSQADFAIKTGISKAAVCLLVSGKIKTAKGWEVTLVGNECLDKERNNKIKTLTNIPNQYTYEAVRLSDGYTEEFYVQRHFAEKYNLSYKGINKVIQGGSKSHRGWTFRIKEEKGEKN